MLDLNFENYEKTFNGDYAYYINTKTGEMISESIYEYLKNNTYLAKKLKSEGNNNDTRNGVSEYRVTCGC